MIVLLDDAPKSHAQQLAEGRSCSDEQGDALNELEAWRWEREFRIVHGESPDQLETLDWIIDQYYRKLDPDVRVHADAGNYSLPDGIVYPPVIP